MPTIPVPTLRKLILAFALLAPVAAAQAPGITVTATGTAYGEPDQASFDAGVSALNPDVQAATDEVNARVSSLVAALRAAGIAERDIRTSNFSVFPEPVYNPQGQITQTRYRVTNTVSVTVRDTAQLGALLGTSVGSGANEIYNVIYTFADQTGLERRAREGAMTRARENAEQLARLGEVELGEVRRVVEGTAPGGVAPFGRNESADVAEAASAPVPVSGGQLAVTVTVQVTYGIEQQ